MTAVAQDARAVLLPISRSLTVEPWLQDFLRAGGRSVLLASSPEEYAARRISDERRAAESAETIRRFTAAVAAASPGPVLAAVDAEPAGVQRLEHLLPPLPGRASIAAMPADALTQAFCGYARAARDLGVTLFLGPVVDHVTGQNPWLQDRTLPGGLDEIARIAVLYAGAVQAAGIIATAKHFPGHSDLAAHPAAEDVTLRLAREHVERNLEPFRRLIDAGVAAVMVGPVTVAAIDPEHPAASSRPLVDLLRRNLGFEGLIVSDDLDLVSTMQGRSLGEVAVSSIAAGVELLLIPGGSAVAEITQALTSAAGNGQISAAALARAAGKVRALANRANRPNRADGADRSDLRSAHGTPLPDGSPQAQGPKGTPHR
jgi:beta-N-acetylhexosaminidase